MIYLKVHGIPCNNRCRHCYYHGGEQQRLMPLENVEKILVKAAELKSEFDFVVVQYFDEMTIHPEWIRILEKQNELGLMYPGFFIPSNGTGIAQLSTSQWKRLSRIENLEFQFTFYGTGETHDDFAGRTGAYENLVKAVKGVASHGFSWTGGIIAWPGNVNELPAIRDEIASLAPGSTGVGWFLPSWLGRGKDSGIRCTLEHMEGLGFSTDHFNSEANFIHRIYTQQELGSRLASDSMCGFLSLEIQPDFTVSSGGACDSALPVDLAGHLKLGKLGDDGFKPIINKYRTKPPVLIRELSRITWKELAEQFGNRSNDQVFLINDLVGNKWLGEYLAGYGESKG